MARPELNLKFPPELIAAAELTEKQRREISRLFGVPKHLLDIRPMGNSPFKPDDNPSTVSSLPPIDTGKFRSDVEGALVYLTGAEQERQEQMETEAKLHDQFVPVLTALAERFAAKLPSTSVNTVWLQWRGRLRIEFCVKLNLPMHSRGDSFTIVWSFDPDFALHCPGDVVYDFAEEFVRLKHIFDTVEAHKPFMENKPEGG